MPLPSILHPAPAHPVTTLAMLLVAAWLWAGAFTPLVAQTEAKPPTERLPYETPPTLQASDLLSSDLLEGANFAVDPDVQTDGFMSYFTIQSHVGTYKTTSVEEAATRVREIQAIAVLDGMKRYEGVGKGIVDGVQEPFLAVKNVVTQPGETAQNLGAGLGRWVGRSKLSLQKLGKRAEGALDQAKETYDARRTIHLAEKEIRRRAEAEGQDPDQAVEAYRRRQEDGQASELAAHSDARSTFQDSRWAADKIKKASLKHLGYDKARRQLAHELGVDPYSTNLPLQERLDAKAWSLWAGHFGTGFALPSSDLLDSARDINDLVWTRHPKDLEVQNRKRMQSMGIDGDVIDGFFDHPLYTVSDRTHMIAHLATLEGVANRDHFFRLAVAAEGRLQAVYYRRNAQMLVHRHRAHPLKSLVPSSEVLVVGVSHDGDALLFLAVDHLAWTEKLDLLISAVERECRNASFEGQVVLLLGGDLTQRARQGIKTVGWQVQTWTDGWLKPTPTGDV